MVCDGHVGVLNGIAGYGGGTAQLSGGSYSKREQNYVEQTLSQPQKNTNYEALSQADYSLTKIAAPTSYGASTINEKVYSIPKIEKKTVTPPPFTPTNHIFQQTSNIETAINEERIPSREELSNKIKAELAEKQMNLVYHP